MPQGYYEVGSGENYDDQTLNSLNVLVLPGGRTANTTINAGGELHLYSNTVANGVTINSGGSLTDNFSATASSVRINSGGRAFISSGGLADNTTIHSGGRLDVISGGTATGIDVLTGGRLWLEVAPDAYARGTINGSTFELGGGAISNYAVHSGCGLDVYIGGLAENTTISSGGKIRIDSGGLVNNVTLDPGGRLEIYPDGTATRIKENGGYIYTLTGSEVMTFIPNSFSGLTLNHGFATVHSGTTATDMTVCSSGIIEVYSSGSANGVQLDDGGRLWIGSGGMASGVTVNSGGSLRILFSGTANDVAIKSGGTLFVSSGGTANDVMIKSGGELFISRGGGKLTGKMTFEKGVIVSSAVSAIIDFDLTQTTAGAAALVNELSVIPDSFLFTLTVDGTQANGTYNLANGAAKFNGSISVVNTSGTELGSLKLGKTIETKSGKYSLNLKSGTLSVTVSSGSHGGTPIPPIPELDDNENDILYDKKTGWNDANITVSNEITGTGEINLDAAGSVNTEDGYHNIFGNDGTNKDTGDVAKIEVNAPAKLIFTIDSTAAGTFYIYEDGFDKKGSRKQITVGKVSVKAGKTATLADVCLTADGKYYAAMVAKNVKKAGTEGRYNVLVSDSTFFVDADKGGNNEADGGKTISVGRGLDKSLILDNAPMTGGTEFKNFVGFTDGKDYAKLDLASSAYLKFNVTGDGDGKAKFTLWKQDAKGKMSKVTGISLPAKKVYDATTKAQFLDTSKYTYYVSMECTDEAKGKGLYYNVQVTDDTVFFDSADKGMNNELYVKKAKSFYDEDVSHHFETTTINGAGTHVKLDTDPVGEPGYDNFVGYEDAIDYAKIELTNAGNLSFHLEATGNAAFTFYRKGQDKKGNDTLETVQTSKLVLAKGASLAEADMLISGLEAGEYYVSMAAKSTKANDTGSVFYNVTATLDASVASALAMPKSELALGFAETCPGSATGLLASL